MFDSDPLPEFLRRPPAPTTPAWCKRERLAVLVGLGAAAILMIVAAVVASGVGAPAAAENEPELRIAVVDPAPQPIVAPSGKLEVLSHVENGFQGVPERPGFPSLAQVFDALIGYGPHPGDAGSDAEVRLVADAAPEPQARPVGPRRYAELSPANWEPARPSFDCRRAASPAEAMVCADARLAAADAALGEALNRAMIHGDPMRILDDHNRWLDARERAAADGPAAVDRLYRVRLRELASY